MRHPKLKEITTEEIQNNIEKYFNSKTQFLLKMKGSKYYRTATIARFEDWDDDLEQDVYYYRFEYENYDRDSLDEDYFENIYIIEE